MALTANLFSNQRQHKMDKEKEIQTLRDGLAKTRILINQAYTGFNSTGDSDLIESYVYEINSLHARYTYLLRRLKELGSQEVCP